MWNSEARDSAQNALLAQFERLAKRFPGDLDSTQLSEAERELREIILRGTYCSRERGRAPVRFENIGCKRTSPTIAGFFVEFRSLSGGPVESLGVAEFLRSYRFLASDCAQI